MVGFDPPTPHGLQITSPLLSPLDHKSLDMRWTERERCCGQKLKLWQKVSYISIWLIPGSGIFRMGLIFAEFATSQKSPKIDTAKNKPYYTSSLRVVEIAKIGLSENLTHLQRVIFAKISRREKFPIYGSTVYNSILQNHFHVKSWILSQNLEFLDITLILKGEDMKILIEIVVNAFYVT